MKTSLSLFLAALTLLPAALAGSAGAPDITDASGDAPAPLDVTSAWFTDAGPTRAGMDDVTVDLTIQLADLGAAAPVADDNRDDSRYYYRLSFTPSSTGSRVDVVCFITQADSSVAGVNAVGGEVGVGTACDVPRDQFSRNLIRVVPKVDVLAGTFTFSLSRPSLTESPGAIPLTPGTSLDDVVIRTSSGSLATTPRPLFGDFSSGRGVVLDTTAPASYVL